MMRSNERTLLLAAALLAAAPLHADWLVTVDGAEIETDGAWKVDGSQVVFTLKGGSLASLPLEDVDLGASEARTRPPAPPEEDAAPPAGAAAPSRWVITDADVARAWSGAVAAGAGAEAAGEGEAAAAAPAARGLTVASWEEVDADEVQTGVALRGTVRNGGEDVATGVAVRVLLFDADGNVLETGTARPAAGTIEPGQGSDFRIDFPDVTHYEGVQFTVEARTLATSGEAAGGGEDDDGGG